MDSHLLLLIVLIFASGVFSSVEIALTALSTTAIRSMEGDGKFGSNAILRLKKYPNRMLISILVGNQVVNVVATVIATLWGVSLFGQERIGMVTAVFTIVLILFGSILPKTFALRFSELFARIMAYPLLVFVAIVRPVIWIIELLIKAIIYILKLEMGELPVKSKREIEAMLDISAEEGLLDESEENFMKQILKSGKTQVKEIMTLLKDIEAIERNAAKEDLAEFMKEHDHTNFPVYEESINNVKGILGIHELIQIVSYGHGGNHPLKKHKLSSSLVVPKTMSLTELFKVLKEKRTRMAIVVDEYGQTVGLVTLGDVFEEITGIYVKRMSEKPEPKIEKVKQNLWIADGEVSVGKINAALDTELPFPEHQTTSLVVLSVLRRFPEVEEKVKLDNVEMTIKKIEKNVVKKVEIRKVKKPEKEKESAKMLED